MFPVDIWGDVASWVQAIGSILAVLIAVIVYLRQSQASTAALQNGLDQLALAQSAFERQVEDQSRGQASMVAAWLEAVEPGPRSSHLWTPSDQALEERREKALESLRSSFERPKSFSTASRATGLDLVEDVPWLVVAWQNLSAQPVFDIDVSVSSVSGEHVAPNEMRWGSWPPAKETRLARVIFEGRGVVVEKSATLASFTVRIAFTDASGIRWTRNDRGGLERA